MPLLEGDARRHLAVEEEAYRVLLVGRSRQVSLDQLPADLVAYREPDIGRIAQLATTRQVLRDHDLHEWIYQVEGLAEHPRGHVVGEAHLKEALARPAPVSSGSIVVQGDLRSRGHEEIRSAVVLGQSMYCAVNRKGDADQGSRLTWVPGWSCTI